MAKLSAHGRKELARRETPTARIAVMSDGNILKNYGTGWKQWKRLKDGVDPVEYARKFDARTAAIHPTVSAYIDTLKSAVALEQRYRLHNYIVLMPNDPDGIWSEFESWNQPDFEDINRACLAYQAAEVALARGEEQ